MFAHPQDIPLVLGECQHSYVSFKTAHILIFDVCRSRRHICILSVQLERDYRRHAYFAPVYEAYAQVLEHRAALYRVPRRQPLNRHGLPEFHAALHAVEGNCRLVCLIKEGEFYLSVYRRLSLISFQPFYNHLSTVGYSLKNIGLAVRDYEIII